MWFKLDFVLGQNQIHTLKMAEYVNLRYKLIINTNFRPPKESHMKKIRFF